MPAAIDDNTGSVFHAGEIALQRELGLADRLEEIGKRMIQRELPEQHRAFYPQLPFIIAGSVDRADDAWATLIAGKPGFPLHSSDHRAADRHGAGRKAKRIEAHDASLGVDAVRLDRAQAAKFSALLRQKARRETPRTD